MAAEIKIGKKTEGVDGNKGISNKDICIENKRIIE